MGAHREKVHRELVSPRTLYRRWRLSRLRPPAPVPRWRTAVGVLRDRDGHVAHACTWSDGSLTIEGVLGPPTSSDGKRYEYTYCVGPYVVRHFVDGLGSPRWSELVRVLASAGSQILDHGNTPLAEVLKIEAFGFEDALNSGGPGSWLAARDVRYDFFFGRRPDHRP